MGLASVRQVGSPAWNLAAVYLLIAGVWAVAGVSWESPLEAPAFCLNRLLGVGHVEQWTSSDQTFVIDSVPASSPDWWSPVEPGLAALPAGTSGRSLSIAEADDTSFVILSHPSITWGARGQLPTGMRQSCVIVSVDTTLANLRRLFDGTRWQCSSNCT